MGDAGRRKRSVELPTEARDLYANHQPHPRPPCWGTPALPAPSALGLPHLERAPWRGRRWSKLRLEPGDQRRLRSAFVILRRSRGILRGSRAFIRSTRTFVWGSSSLL